MYRATGGVNTHKGAVFTMGLACAAAGRLILSETVTPEAILSGCSAITKGLTQQELGHITLENARTAGERLYAQYGITGIRGQAEQGFPAVLNHGLPVLRQGLSVGLSMDCAGCAALLALITATDDTNLIHRGSRETQLAIQSRLRALLAQTPFPEESELLKLDQEFVQHHLSPGGSADLLALCLFLHFLFG
jgi:triphosphoribosyl-dephospho-CoA synthetase